MMMMMTTMMMRKRRKPIVEVKSGDMTIYEKLNQINGKLEMQK